MKYNSYTCVVKLNKFLTFTREPYSNMQFYITTNCYQLHQYFITFTMFMCLLQYAILVAIIFILQIGCAVIAVISKGSVSGITSKC